MKYFKRILIIFLTLFLIITFFSCKSQRSEGGLNGLIIGKWKAVNFGNVVVQLGLSLPATYIFKDGKFTAKLTVAGKTRVYKGEYSIDPNKRPAVIIMKRLDGRIFHGIIKFTGENKFKMVLYDKNVLPLTSEFSESDVQIYKRID